MHIVCRPRSLSDFTYYKEHLFTFHILTSILLTWNVNISFLQAYLSKTIPLSSQHLVADELMPTSHLQLYIAATCKNHWKCKICNSEAKEKRAKVGYIIELIH